MYGLSNTVYWVLNTLGKENKRKCKLWILKFHGYFDSCILQNLGNQICKYRNVGTRKIVLLVVNDSYTKSVDGTSKFYFFITVTSEGNITFESYIIGIPGKLSPLDVTT